MDKRFIVEGVTAQTLLEAAAPALLQAKSEPLFELEAAAAGGADMDAVHDMRVASRRLREAMRLLAPVYPSSRFKAWYRRVRRITRALGPVRDSDVFIDYFSRLLGELSEEGRRCVVFMIGYRMGQREHELEGLNSELAKLDLADSRQSFSVMARSVGGSAGAKRPLADFAHAAIAERAAQVFGAQPLALDQENVVDQHALRIHYKRLRYAVEAFASCYGEDFDELHETLTAFQDALGDLHDVHVFMDMVVSPDRVEAATRAGASMDGIDELERVLAGRAQEQFDRFARLADERPAERLLPMLLLPLSRPQSAAPDVEPEVIEPDAATAEEPGARKLAGDAGAQPAAGEATSVDAEGPSPLPESRVAEDIMGPTSVKELLADPIPPAFPASAEELATAARRAAGARRTRDSGGAETP